MMYVRFRAPLREAGISVASKVLIFVHPLNPYASKPLLHRPHLELSRSPPGFSPSSWILKPAMNVRQTRSASFSVPTLARGPKADITARNLVVGQFFKLTHYPKSANEPKTVLPPSHQDDR